MTTYSQLSFLEYYKDPNLNLLLFPVGISNQTRKFLPKNDFIKCGSKYSVTMLLEDYKMIDFLKDQYKIESICFEYPKKKSFRKKYIPGKSLIKSKPYKKKSYRYYVFQMINFEINVEINSCDQKFYKIKVDWLIIGQGQIIGKVKLI